MSQRKAGKVIAVDATYQNQLREINELNWQRFSGEMDVPRGLGLLPIACHARS